LLNLPHLKLLCTVSLALSTMITIIVLKVMHVGFHPAGEGGSPRKIGWGYMTSFPKPLPYSRQFPSKRTCHRFQNE